MCSPRIIAAVMTVRPLVNRRRARLWSAAKTRSARLAPGVSPVLLRFAALTVVIVLLFGSLPGTDADAQLLATPASGSPAPALAATPTTPAPAVTPAPPSAAVAAPSATPSPATRVRATSDSRPAQVGGFVTGTVWDDTRIRNGVFDDNEPGLANVTVVVERIDVPSGPIACTTAIAGNVNPTDSSGRYRCGGLVDGVYRISVSLLSNYEATTSRQRDVTVTATEGGRANFGLARLDQGIRSISGVVFLDCNENGIQDLPVEFDDRPSSSAYEVRLERVGGNDNNNQSPDSTRENHYVFDNLSTGTYVVSLRVSSSRFRATTATRREITIGSTFGATADFGIVDDTANSRCTRSLNSTATSVASTATAISTRAGTPGSTSSGASGLTGGGLTGGGTPAPATATALAIATATAARFTPTPTRTPTPSATPVPPVRMERAYPRSARFLMQAVARFANGERIDMLAEGALIGLETIVFQDTGQRVGSEQLSMRIRRNDHTDDVVVTAQQAFRQRDTDDLWRTVNYSEIRNELGLLAPLDAITALRCVSRGQEGGQVVVDNAVTNYFLGEVDVLRFWETSIRPRYAGGSGGGSSTNAPTISTGRQVTGSGRIIPACTPPPETRVEQPAVQGAQPVYQDMQVQTWIGLDDGLIRAERMTAKVLPPIADPKRMPDPIDFDAVFTFWDVNKPITIIPPRVPEPTATLTTAAAAPGGAGGRQSGLIEAPAPVAPPASSAPTPGLTGVSATPGELGTPEQVVAEETPTEGQGPTPSQNEQVLAAERALVAIATGGEPLAGSTARGNSILLDVPFRSQQTGTTYASTNSGAASMAMILGGYGVNVAVADLRALLNGLDGNYSPGVPSRIETMARVGERAGLNAVDLFRGARFNEWTVEQVREMIRRGYPVVTLVQGAVLPGGTPPGVARERYITIVGIDGDDFIYNDPAYPDEGSGADRRINSRTLEQAWLAASTPRLAAGFSLGPEGRGMLDFARGQAPESTAVAQASPTPNLEATVAVVGTIQPTPTTAPPEYPFGLPVHPILVLFWLILVILLVIILIRSLV
ncbi:MAG: C39 family peptidase [Chloroflexi bacterium]|nr:C39 family peptidase [Chloroflexota bacterium]